MHCILLFYILSLLLLLLLFYFTKNMSLLWVSDGESNDSYVVGLMLL